MEKNYKVFTDPRNKEIKEKSYHVLVKENTKKRLNSIKAGMEQEYPNIVSYNDVIEELIDHFYETQTLILPPLQSYDEM